MNALEALVATTGGVAAGVCGDRLALRRERTQQRETRLREAGERLLVALREMRELFRRSQSIRLDSEAWAAGIIALARADEDVAHRLPPGWGHLLRSVRAATGEFIGAPSLADLDSRVIFTPVAAHDERWRQYGLEYLDYVTFRVQSWTDEPSRREVRRPPLTFDNWLATTGRHGERTDLRRLRWWRWSGPRTATSL
jgi:hypothetical protein